MGCLFFFLSRPVNRNHNSHALVGWCSDAVLQWLESKFWLNLLTWVLWNSLPANLRHLDLSLGQFRRLLKTHLFWRSLRFFILHLHFTALTINLLTYLLYKRSNSNNTSFVQNCSRCIENYCFKQKKPRRLQGALPPDPYRGLFPWYVFSDTTLEIVMIVFITMKSMTNVTNKVYRNSVAETTVSARKRNK